MKFQRTNRRDGTWHEWFAWHPVVTDCATIAWLEVVRRRWDTNRNLRVIAACDSGEFDGGWQYEVTP